jgi:hypothetical protein
MVDEKKKITLSKEDYEKLLGIGADLEHAKFELERAKKVGIDVKDIEAELNKVIDLRQRILEEYKPEK